MMAAWQVRPPRLVTMALARFITGSQFGSVMSVTSTSPALTRSMSATERDQPHRAGADLLANGATFDEDRPRALQRVALLDLALRLALHRLGTGLQDVELAVGAVLAPLDVHRPAVVVLDDHGIARQFHHVGVGEREAVALLRRGVDGRDELAAGGMLVGRGEAHADELRAEIPAHDGLLAVLQGRLVHVELVGVDGALHHGLAEAVARGDEDHLR